MQLAEAVGTPVVAIFSARDFPGKWYPYGEKHRVIRKSIECEVCYKEECEHISCLKSISVEEVLEACDKVIQGSMICVASVAG
ncbi:MAG TPA: hypothetical protein EYP21_01060 [Syntrophaceae bacterium]|nr:hypothetical protein [Syntrophaceae bacterium]